MTGLPVGAFAIAPFLFEQFPVGLKIGMSVVLGWGGYVLGEVFYAVHFALRDQVAESLTELKTHVLDKLLPNALFSNGPGLRAALAIVRDNELKESVRWTLARFVGFRIDREFQQALLCRNVSDSEYLDLAKALIPACEESIHLTCPFSPYEWLYRFVDSQRLEQVLAGSPEAVEHLDLNVWIGHHEALKAFSGRKTRVVLLDENEWSFMVSGKPVGDNAAMRELTPDQAASCWHAFMRLSREAGLELYFVNLDRCEEQVRRELDRFDLRNTDYGLYDESLLIKWTKRGSAPSPEVRDVTVDISLLGVDPVVKLLTGPTSKKYNCKMDAEVLALCSLHRDRYHHAHELARGKEISALYSAELYDRAIEVGHPEYGRMHDVMVTLCRKHLTNGSGNVVDIGAGTGTLTRKIASAFPAASVVGLEPDGNWSRFLAASVAQQQNVNVREFTDGNVLLFDDNDVFDVALMSFSLHHVEEAKRGEALGRVRRALRTHGALVVAEEFIPDYRAKGRGKLSRDAALAIYHGSVIACQERQFEVTHDEWHLAAAAIEAKALQEASAPLWDGLPPGESKLTRDELAKIAVEEHLRPGAEHRLFPNKQDDWIIGSVIEMFSRGRVLVKDNGSWTLRPSEEGIVGEVMIQPRGAAEMKLFETLVREQWDEGKLAGWGIFVVELLKS